MPTHQGRGSLQDIDQLSVLRPIVKCVACAVVLHRVVVDHGQSLTMDVWAGGRYAASCSNVRDIVPTLRKAFQEAASGVPGPVFVEFPLDVLYPISGTRVCARTVRAPVRGVGRCVRKAPVPTCFTTCQR